MSIRGINILNRIRAALSDSDYPDRWKSNVDSLPSIYLRNVWVAMLAFSAGILHFIILYSSLSYLPFINEISEVGFASNMTDM